MSFGFPGLGGGGGGGGSGGGWPPATSSLQNGNVAVSSAVQSYAITFSPSFASPPPYFNASLAMASSASESFSCSWDVSTLATSGVTVWLSGLPTAASTGSKIYWEAHL
jgi:hypothetical protein